MPLIYRDFTGSDDDFALLTEIGNAGNDTPQTVKDVRERDAMWLLDQHLLRSLIYENENCIGATMRFTDRGEEGGTSHTCAFTLLPTYRDRGFESQVLEHLVDTARREGAKVVKTVSGDNDQPKQKAIENLGFTQDECFVSSRLDLSLFDPARFEAKIQRVKEAGVSIRSSAELAEEGIDWLYNLYGFLGLHETITYEQFQAREMKPGMWFPESQYAAYAEGHAIGLAYVYRIPEMPHRAHSGFTCVDPDYRRTGVATALKVAGLTVAKQAGVRLVETCNDARNPMLQLNYQLGYEKFYADLAYRLTM